MENSQPVSNNSLKGINYGKYEIDKENFKIEYEGKSIFKIPLTDIVNSCV